MQTIEVGDDIIFGGGLSSSFYKAQVITKSLCDNNIEYIYRVVIYMKKEYNEPEFIQWKFIYDFKPRAWLHVEIFNRKPLTAFSKFINDIYIKEKENGKQSI